VYVRRRFTFSRQLMIEHELPNAAFWLINPKLGDASHRSGILSFLYLALASPLGPHMISEAIRLRQIETSQPPRMRLHIANVVKELGPAAAFALTYGYGRFLKRGRKPPGVFVSNAANVYPLNYHGEHLPHQASHVALTSEPDALGVPRLRTSLRFSDANVESVIRSHLHFDRYVRRHGLGRLEYLHEDLQGAIRKQLFGGYHQAGTTRMSARAEDGVLDANLAIHGFDDLFVASSSAFVTSSQANTTFMIVAFALRLADHLHRGLRS
jgi:choline dehydrogenase-like flavoprotein